MFTSTVFWKARSEVSSMQGPQFGAGLTDVMANTANESERAVEPRTDFIRYVTLKRKLWLLSQLVLVACQL